MALRLSEKQLQELLGREAEKRAAKWGNEKAPLDGLVFDSKLEARHYAVLLIRQQAGEIRKLARQVKFLLEVNGHRITSFTADFVYDERVEIEALWGKDHQWKRVVVDCKSEATRAERSYRIKFKLMQAIHGITIIEVTDGKDVKRRRKAWKTVSSRLLSRRKGTSSSAGR